jgi:hypothetical protein
MFICQKLGPRELNIDKTPRVVEEQPRLALA